MALTAFNWRFCVSDLDGEEKIVSLARFSARDDGDNDDDGCSCKPLKSVRTPRNFCGLCWPQVIWECENHHGNTMVKNRDSQRWTHPEINTAHSN